MLAALCALAPAAHARAQRPAPSAQAGQDFRVYDSSGRPSSLDEVVGAMASADAVLVGEEHDDAVGHRLEAELLRRAFDRYGAHGAKPARRLALSLEMFERDVQTVVDEYLSGLISERHFLLSSRPWRNYGSDYRPLVEFALAHGMPVIAANAPARYVSRVAQGGPASLDALSKEAKTWLAPLPFAPASREYAAKFALLMGDSATPTHAAPAPQRQQPARQQQPAAHAAVSLLDAQNLRDATMAYAVAAHLKGHAGALVLHVNGRFHSEGRLGVAEHLARYQPKTRLLVVTILPADSFPHFEASGARGLGDFVILTDPAAARPR